MALDKDIRELIKKYAVKNAFDYGSASEASVLNKILSRPELKGKINIAEMRKAVTAVVAEVNAMAQAQLREEYSKHKAEFESAEEERVKKTEKPRMELEGVVAGEFATRWPPEPSGYMHVGHAKPIFLEDEFRKIYRGKFFLYFDDTNPEKETQAFVDADKADLAWLGIKFDDEYYASDHIEKIYGYAKKLIEADKAYVCMCDRDTMQKKRFDGEGCEHRIQNAKENLDLFEQMLRGEFDEGDAVLRFKGNMKSQNTAMRDTTIARIKKDRHYRQGNKYFVWPTYDLGAPIMDSIKGVTDIMRSKEYELRDELDRSILKALGLRVPRIHSFARFNVIGNMTHKRMIRKLIDDGVIKDWDDPRLMTFFALKRRGIMPEAIRNFVLRSGMTKNDSEVPLEMLFAENRKVIDPIAKHLFFVPSPVRIVVKGAVPSTVKLPLHPTNKLGDREYKLGKAFYIPSEDFYPLKDGEVVRLKDLVAIRMTDRGKAPAEAEVVESTKGKVIQWVSEENSEECALTIPGELVDKDDNFNKDSLTVKTGRVESYAGKLKEHEVVQFERVGYAILDKKDGLQFIFTSK